MAAPPITVSCIMAGPDAPVDVPASHPLVVQTAYLGWDAGPIGVGGVAQARLSTFQILVVFGRRLGASQTPADLPAARKAHPLNLGFNGPFWVRVLNELISSGLLGIAATSRAELIEGIDGLTLLNPANLSIMPADWQLGEDTAFVAAVAPVPAVAAVAAQRARGRPGQRGYVAAVPRVPAQLLVPGVPGRPALDPALTFLTLVTALDLEDEGPSPWALLAYLAGMLGACLSQAERNRAASQVQFSARALAAGCHHRYNTSAGDDHSLAGNLKDFLRDIAQALPKVMLSSGLDAMELRAEGRDAIKYVRDEEGRRSIEQSRIFSFGSSCAQPALRGPSPPRTSPAARPARSHDPPLGDRARAPRHPLGDRGSPPPLSGARVLWREPGLHAASAAAGTP